MKNEFNEDFREIFEIPLTFEGEEILFDNIIDNGQYLNPAYIQSVYMPVHGEDGESGRVFLYKYNKDEYYDLIKRILVYKPIVLTYPKGDVGVIKKYCELGVRGFMVSEWNDEFFKLKSIYKGLKFHRSIVGNSYNENIDERFDSIVVAYHKMLDVDYLREASKKVDLVLLCNHHCNPACVNIDNHLFKTDSRIHGYFICPQDTNSYFVPRQALLRVLPYVKTLKLVDRCESAELYETCLNYYTGDSDFDVELIGDRDTIRLVLRFILKDRLYPYSRMAEGNCEFKCKTCDRKCF